MQKCLVVISLLVIVVVLVSFSSKDNEADNLRKIYSQPSSQWPAPFIDEGVDWKELGMLPESPTEHQKDSLKHLIKLGKILFFDTRLSGSGKISCATCHQPELNWTDGKEKSIGHEGTFNKRNSPTIQNTWFYKKLFWDGRSNSLEDQAFAPINSESEMHGDIKDLPRSLRKVKQYVLLFDSAFGDPAIDPDRIATALATFERTITSRKSKFDEFLSGNKRAMNNDELKGLHLFRTKARCMNCHNGPVFSDNSFHKSVFGEVDDEGLFNVTHKEDDIGKFKTPSLRDVIRTGPWGHAGKVKPMMDILLFYNKMSPSPATNRTQKLYLNSKELSALLYFLEAISSQPVSFIKPHIPQ